MGEITGTLAKRTELSGDYKLYVITATAAATSDTITLSAATHGISEIAGIVSCVATGGLDANFTYLQASYSELVITVVSLKQDGAAADNFTGTTITVTVLGK